MPCGKFNLYSSIHADTSWTSIVARTTIGIDKPETFTRIYLDSEILVVPGVMILAWGLLPGSIVVYLGVLFTVTGFAIPYRSKVNFLRLIFGVYIAHILYFGAIYFYCSFLSEYRHNFGLWQYYRNYEDVYGTDHGHPYPSDHSAFRGMEYPLWTGLRASVGKFKTGEHGNNVQILVEGAKDISPSEAVKFQPSSIPFALVEHLYFSLVLRNR